MIPRLLDKSEIFGLRDEFLAALIEYVPLGYLGYLGKVSETLVTESVDSGVSETFLSAKVS